MEVNRLNAVLLFESLVVVANAPSRSFSLLTDDGAGQLTFHSERVFATSGVDLIAVVGSPFADLFEGAVSSTKLIDALKNNFKCEMVNVTVTKELLVITEKIEGTSTGSRRAEFRISKPQLVVDQIEESLPGIGDWVDVDAGYASALQSAASVASSTGTRFDLQCVHVTKDRLEACDNYQMIRIDCSTGVTKDQLVPSRSVSCVSQVTAVCETDKFLFFKKDDGTIIGVRRFFDEYPDLSGFLKINDAEDFEIPQALTGMASRAASFADAEGGWKSVNVVLEDGNVSLDGGTEFAKYSETLKCSYSGAKIAFSINADLLKKLPLLASSSKVCDNRIVVDGDGFQYVVSLRTN